jgi:hypothetical protein
VYEISKKAFVAARSMPKSVWVAAILVPGAFTAVGIYISAKGLYDSIKSKIKND